MHRHHTVSSTTDDGALSADRWSLSLRDALATIRPLSIDELLDIAEALA